MYIPKKFLFLITWVSFPLSGDGIAHGDVVAPARLVHVGVGLVVGVTVRADNVAGHRALAPLIACGLRRQKIRSLL